MPANTPRGPMEVIKDNHMRILLRNKETLIAAFFRKHPNIDPARVRMCTRHTVDGKTVMWIEVGKATGER